MAWRVLLIVGAVLTVALAGTAIYANGQPAEVRCIDHQDLVPGDPGYIDPNVEPTLDQILNSRPGPCIAYSDDAPLPVLRSGTTTWWWFSAAAVAVLTLAAIPLLRRRTSSG